MFNIGPINNRRRNQVLQNGKQLLFHMWPRRFTQRKVPSPVNGITLIRKKNGKDYKVQTDSVYHVKQTFVWLF